MTAKYKDLPQEQAQYLLQFKKALLDTLESQLTSLKSDIADLEAIKKAPPGNWEAPKATNRPKSSDEEGWKYDKSWTWGKKILFAVHFRDRPLTSPEIMAAMSSAEQDLFQYISDPVNTLSVHLRNLVKQERIKQYKVKGERGFFYAHPSWFNSDDTLQEKYLNKIKLL